MLLVLYITGSAGVSHWKIDESGRVVAIKSHPQWEKNAPIYRSQFGSSIADKAESMLMRMSFKLESTRNHGMNYKSKLQKRSSSNRGTSTDTVTPKQIKSTLEFDDDDDPGLDTDLSTITEPHYLKLQQEERTLSAPSLLSCIPVAEITRFDHLSGIYDRSTVPQIVEKDVYSSLLPMNSPTNLEILSTNNLFDLLKKNPELYNRLEPKRGTPALLNAVGQLYRVRGNTTLAIECFRSVLALSPRDEAALLNLCDTLFRLEKWKEAEEVIKYSLSFEEHRQVGQNHFALGRTLLAQGRNVAAVASFKECLRLNPNHHTAQAGLAVSRSLANTKDSNFYTTVIIGVCILATLLLVYNMMSVQAKINQTQEQLDDMKKRKRSSKHPAPS